MVYQIQFYSSLDRKFVPLPTIIILEALIFTAVCVQTVIHV